MMTPDQRRAHNILHGQTMLDEWLEYCGGPMTIQDRSDFVMAVRRWFGPDHKIIWNLGTTGTTGSMGSLDACRIELPGGAEETYRSVCWLSSQESVRARLKRTLTE